MVFMACWRRKLSRMRISKSSDAGSKEIIHAPVCCSAPNIARASPWQLPDPRKSGIAREDREEKPVRAAAPGGEGDAASAHVDARAGQSRRRQKAGRIDQRKALIAGQKRSDAVLVLGGKERAGDIGQPAARAHETRRLGKHG